MKKIPHASTIPVWWEVYRKGYVNSVTNVTFVSYAPFEKKSTESIEKVRENAKDGLKAVFFILNYKKNVKK